MMPLWWLNLRGSLRLQTRPLLGIDVGSSSIKLVQLAKANNRTPHAYRIEYCAIEPLAPAENKEIKETNLDTVTVAITRALAGMRRPPKKAAVSIPGNKTITKVISMPSGLSDDEMEGQIKAQADLYIPFPLEEVNLDFTVLGPSATSDEVDVLLAAARLEEVGNYFAPLQLSDLELAIVDVEPFALHNACEDVMGLIEPGEAAAIVDIGTHDSRLLVVKDGRLVFNRDFSFAADQLIEEVMARYQMTSSVASHNVMAGILPGDFLVELAIPFQEAMAAQITRSLQFYYSSSNATSVDKVLLSGGMACLPQFAVVVQRQTGILTSIANPFLHMEVGASADRNLISQSGPAFGIATGLALRNFDPS